MRSKLHYRGENKPSTPPDISLVLAEQVVRDVLEPHKTGEVTRFRGIRTHSQKQWKGKQRQWKKKEAEKLPKRVCAQAFGYQQARQERRLVIEMEGVIKKSLSEGRFFVYQAADPQVAATVQLMLERVPEMVAARKQALTERNVEALVEVFMADNPLASVEAEIEADNAALRSQFIKDVDLLTAQRVHARSGNKAKNTSVTASRWKAEKKIFAVSQSGKDLFPTFQFDEGLPKPVIAEVLRRLPASMTPWQIAFWFMSGNGWLDGDAPASRLGDRDKLLAAAGHEAEAVIG